MLCIFNSNFKNKSCVFNSTRIRVEMKFQILRFVCLLGEDEISEYLIACGYENDGI